MTFFGKLLYPPRCPGCDEIIYPKEWKEGFCKKCNYKVIRNKDSCCIKCGKPLQKNREEYCYDCKKKYHYFEQNRAVYLYCGPMKLSMYRLKYSNRRCYAEVFAKEAFERCGWWLREIGVEAIVPVPMYPKKERVRGYNQATVLAKELGRLMNVPVLDKYVLRIRNSRPQKELNDTERKNNMENAFKIRKNDVKLKKILLIDDIYTTGSTMDQVSKVLKADGIEFVYCLSICIGEGRE